MMRVIERRVEFIKPLLDDPADCPEYSEIEVALAWKGLKLRFKSHDETHSRVSSEPWGRLSKWGLAAIGASLLVALLFSIPLVRNSAKQAFDALRRISQTSDHNSSRDSRRPIVAADVQKSPSPSQLLESGHDSRLPYPPGGYLGGSEALPNRMQPPDYLPKNNQKLAAFRSGFEPGTEYVITGDVRSESGEPIPGAVVSYHRSGFNYRDYEMPAPVSTQVTDESGHYSINIDSPSEVVLTVSADGFARFMELFWPLEKGTTTRNFRLRRAACVEGFVRDKENKPIENVMVRADASELNWGSSYFSAVPLRTVTDSAGEYSIRGIAEGGGTITASSSRYLSRHQSGFLARGECTQMDFQLSPARSFTVTVKNLAGEALTDAHIWTHWGIPANSDSQGRMEFAADPDSDPFDCWVFSKGFRAAHLLLSSKNPTLDVVLEKGKVFSGRVLSQSGEPVANAAIDLFAGIQPQSSPGGLSHGPPALEKTVTDDSGKFSILSDYPVIRVIASKGGRGEAYDFTMMKPAPQELEIRFKEQRGGGVYGRAVDSTGKPSERFNVCLYDRTTFPPRGGCPEFQNEAGAFLMDDLPAGIYDLEASSAPFSQTERGAYLKLGRVEIREGLVFGEIRIQFPPPKIVR